MSLDTCHGYHHDYMGLVWPAPNTSFETCHGYHRGYQWVVWLCCGLRQEPKRQKEVALLEAEVYRLAELLLEQRSATRDNVQRKQAQTGEEREDDGEENYPESESSDDDDDDIPYNPKNLPLGWDGKVGVKCVELLIMY